MTRILKERKFSGTTDPKVQPWELEHRKVARRAFGYRNGVNGLKIQLCPAVQRQRESFY